MRTVGLRGEGQEAVATSFTIGDTVEITWRPDRPVRVDARMYEGHRADVHPLYQVASYFRARWSVMTKPSSSTRTPLHGGTGNTGGNSGFFIEDPATTEIYTLSLHDALPIRLLDELSAGQRPRWTLVDAAWTPRPAAAASTDNGSRSEEHTSELQSRPHL